MTEDGKNAVKDYLALKEEDNKIKNNQIELDEYFKYSGKTEPMHNAILQEIEFQKKRKSNSLLYMIKNYKRGYVSNPNRVKPKRKLNK
tara:strand:- start:3989 stop:4252 length:264 start_codon:yes stop_codon:yes gene_type:complete